MAVHEVDLTVAREALPFARVREVPTLAADMLPKVTTLGRVSGTAMISSGA